MGARRRCSSREGVSVTREGAETGGWARTRTHVGREVEQVGSVCCENLGIGSTRLHERLCVSAEAFSVLSVRDCSMTSICADELTSRDVVLKADSRRKQPPPDCRNANGTGVAVLEVAVLAEGCSEGARRIGEESSLQDLCRVSSSVWVGVVAVMRAWRRSSRTRTAATLCEEARHAGRVLRSALPQNGRCQTRRRTGLPTRTTAIRHASSRPRGNWQREILRSPLTISPPTGMTTFGTKFGQITT